MLGTPRRPPRPGISNAPTRPTLRPMLLTPAQQMVRDEARRFAATAIAPHAGAWEETGGVPGAVLRRMGELGFFGMLVPERWDGSGLDFVSYALVTEAIAGADCGVCNLMNVSNSPVCAALRDYGNDAQRERFLRPLAAGAQRGCFLLTEPQAGSDASQLQTRAIRRGDRFVLRGTKQFVTGGRSASVAMIVAVTDPAAGKRGMTCFLARTDAAGYRVARLEEKLGHRNCDTCQVVLEDLEIPEEDVLGKEGEGYKIALSYLNGGRIGVAAQGVGVAQAALEAATAYASQRVAFGQPIIEHQAVAFRLADMATRVEAARAMTLHAAALEDAGTAPPPAASMAKLFASETAERVTSDAIQIHGGYGYLRDHSVEKLYRDARVLQIYEGTSEVQRLVIARGLAAGHI